MATLELHMERYRFAAGQLRPGSLLDIACGVGYGTHYLATSCTNIERVVGVDISAAAIEYASSRYTHPRIAWHTGDAMTLEAEEEFDNIVSLETIEHVPDPQAFFRKIVGWLRPGGVLVASVPSTPSMDGNPHHLTDFTEASFRRLAQGLPLRERTALRQVQPFSAAAVVAGQERRMSRTRDELAAFYLRHPGKALSRIAATARYGFTNRYLTVAWDRESLDAGSPPPRSR